MEDPKILLDAFGQKPAAAIEYLKRKGYACTWNWFDLWKDAHARAFTVAKAMKVDVVREIRNMVHNALYEGMSLTQFQKELEPILQKRGWWGKKELVNKETGEITEYMAGSPRRLKTIFETNLQTAYMAGRYRGQMEAAADLPNWQYIAVMDGKTTDSCRDLHGKIFRADDPFWNEFYPPNHWGCRSRVRALTDKQVERLGGKPESSKGRIVEREVVVGKGDKARVETVSGLKLKNGKTYWTGAGWNYNPGREAWMPDLSVYHQNDAKAFIRDGLSGPDYTRFLEAKGKIGGEVPIAVLPDDYMKALGTDVSIVRLSADSLWKNTTHHDKIPVSDYQQLQLFLEDAYAAAIVPGKDRGESLVAFSKGEDSYYKVVLKATEDKRSVYFLSLYPVEESAMRGVLSRAITVIRERKK